MPLRPELPLGRAPGPCGPGQPVPTQAHSRPRAPLTDRRLHLIKGKKKGLKSRFCYYFPLIKVQRGMAQLCHRLVLHFAFFFHASTSSSSCLRLLSLSLL